MRCSASGARVDATRSTRPGPIRCGHEDRAGQPGLGARRDLRFHGARLRVSGGGGGPGQPQDLAHRLAIMLEAVYAVETPEDAFARYGHPDVVKTGLGRQFTAGAATETVPSRSIRLSMDGKGARRSPCVLIQSINARHAMGMELRFRTNENINGGLTCNLRYEVRPALGERTMPNRNDRPVDAGAADIMALYRERHTVHILRNLGQCHMDFETPIGNQSIHVCSWLTYPGCVSRIV